MNKKINFLQSFPDIKEKGKLYDLYRGFVHCLNNFEAFELLINEETKGLRAEALIRKITYSFTDKRKKRNSKLLQKAIDMIKKLKWPQNNRVAKVLFRISPYICFKDKINLVKYFLSSNYISFRRYGYDIIEKNGLESNLKKEFLRTWGEYHDIKVLDLMVNVLAPKDLFSIYKDAEKTFTESEFDFGILKLRNKYYSKIVKYIPKKLLELKSSDPVSYVFVMKDAGKEIDKDLAVEIYKKNNNYRSLLTCYGDLGMWNVLMEIYNLATEETKTSMQGIKNNKNHK